MAIDITTTRHLKDMAGVRVTIQGVAFGQQYEGGFTTKCRPGNETQLTVGESFGSLATVKPAKQPPKHKRG